MIKQRSHKRRDRVKKSPPAMVTAPFSPPISKALEDLNDCVSPSWGEDKETAFSPTPDSSSASEALSIGESTRDVLLSKSAWVATVIYDLLPVDKIFTMMMLDFYPNSTSRKALISPAMKADQIEYGEKKESAVFDVPHHNSNPLLGPVKEKHHKKKGCLKKPTTERSRISGRDFNAFDPVTGMYTYRHHENEQRSPNIQITMNRNKSIPQSAYELRKPMSSSKDDSRTLQNVTESHKMKKIKDLGKSPRRVRFDLPSDGNVTEEEGETNTPNSETSDQYQPDIDSIEINTTNNSDRYESGGIRFSNSAKLTPRSRRSSVPMEGREIQPFNFSSKKSSEERELLDSDLQKKKSSWKLISFRFDKFGRRKSDQ